MPYKKRLTGAALEAWRKTPQYKAWKANKEAEENQRRLKAQEEALKSSPWVTVNWRDADRQLQSKRAADVVKYETTKRQPKRK